MLQKRFYVILVRIEHVLQFNKHFITNVIEQKNIIYISDYIYYITWLANAYKFKFLLMMTTSFITKIYRAERFGFITNQENQSFL
jgi:hypothetical protein